MAGLYNKRAFGTQGFKSKVQRSRKRAIKASDRKLHNLDISYKVADNSFPLSRVADGLHYAKRQEQRNNRALKSRGTYKLK